MHEDNLHGLEAIVEDGLNAEALELEAGPAAVD